MTPRRAAPAARLTLPSLATLATLAALPTPALAEPAPAAPPAAAYDAALAERLGADARGMRRYVLAVLKTGPTRVPDGAERDAMFRGHFANMQGLADAGKLVLAGPFDGVDGWRGLMIFAVTEIEEARRLAASDPVLSKGEMVAEFHTYYGSAALMQVPATHATLTPPPR